MTAPDLVVRDMTDDDLPAVLELLQASLAGGPTGTRTAEFFRWKHQDNPFGASLALVATHGPRVVGVRLLLRWELRARGQIFTAVRMVDTATHPDAQGRGIFRTLTTEAVSRCGADLVFNTPNAQSQPGYLRMGWQHVGLLPVAVRAARPVRLARALRAGVGQGRVDGAPAPVDSPLPRAADGLDRLAELDLDPLALTAGLSTPRTPGYLTWRYAAAPGLDYRAVPVERGGRLVGLGLGRVRRRGPLTELTLGEVLTAPGDADAARRVLRAAARGGTDVVTAHLPRATATGLRAGYVAPPRRGISLTTRPLQALPLDPASPSSWSLSLGDLEVF